MTSDERIERLAAELGCGAEARVDLERVAREVVVRLHEERGRRSRPSWRRSPLLRAAALIALLIGGSVVMRGVGREAVPADDFAGPMALEELTAADLGEVLDSLTYEAPVSEFVAASLDDLDESQLRELLATLES